MRKQLLVSCLIALVTAGCGGIANPTPMPAASNSISYPADKVVLQLAHGGGFVMIDRVSELVPDVTVWGDGRVVYVAPDGVVREGLLSAEAVARLLESASFLYGLESDSAAVQHTDAPTATFAIFTDQGAKRVSVYGLDPLQQPEDEAASAVFNQLRALWAKVSEALPAEAPEVKPTSVCIQTFHSNEPATAEWPAELKGCLTGERAEQAVTLGGLGTGKTFRVGDQSMLVMVIPQLPEPGQAEKPVIDSANPPANLAGSAQDEALSLEATAEQQADGSYKVVVTATNKSAEGLNLLFDCGSLFSWVGLGQPADDGEGAICAAVHSQLLEADAKEQWELSLDPEAIADWNSLALYLRYELTSGQGAEVEGLEIKLAPVSE